MSDIVLAELQNIVMKCIELAQNGKSYKANKLAYRSLGLEADDMGGIEAMRFVYYAVAKAYEDLGLPDGPDDFHPSELQAAWDGVGEWKW